jgi:P-type Ca2+ transporter type 2C
MPARTVTSQFRDRARLWAALALTFAVEAAALTVPALRDLLGLATLTPAAWGIALALALVPLAAVQLPLLLRASSAGPGATR